MQAQDRKAPAVRVSAHVLLTHVRGKSKLTGRTRDLPKIEQQFSRMGASLAAQEHVSQDLH